MEQNLGKLLWKSQHNKNDPVRRYEIGYGFWDETWSYFHGPFKTICEARSNLKNYLSWLDNNVYFNKLQINNFIKEWNKIKVKVHDIAKEKGWHENEINNGEIIALMHSELSEALEGLRHGNPKSDKIPNFSSVEEEMADVVIRIMDVSELRCWDVCGAIIAKIEYNKSRTYKHGGKEF